MRLEPPHPTGDGHEMAFALAALFVASAASAKSVCWGSTSCHSSLLRRHPQDDLHHQCGRGATPVYAQDHQKTRGSFPNDAALKLLILAVKNAGLRWRQGVELTAAMGQFVIQFGECFPGTVRG